MEKWISKGRLSQLIGCEEACKLMQELPTKLDASGRQLFLLSKKCQHKALRGVRWQTLKTLEVSFR